jgi:electron transfer flavoprotein beta subunit
LAFHIVVCIKAVITNPSSSLSNRHSDSCDLNAYDKPALEAALQLKKAHGGSVTALSMGPESTSFILNEAMALGVDRAVLLNDRNLAGSDTLATAIAMAAAVKKLVPFDILLFGLRSSDSDTGHVGPQVSALLSVPMVTGVRSIEVIEEDLLVERQADGFMERYQLTLPVALTIHPASQPAHDIALHSIGAAYEEQKIEYWDLNTLDLNPSQVGERGSGTQVLSLSRSVEDRACDFLSGSAEEQAEELARRLMESN